MTSQCALFFLHYIDFLLLPLVDQRPSAALSFVFLAQSLAFLKYFTYLSGFVTAEVCRLIMSI